MGSFLCITIVLIQLTSIFAIEPIPLKCFLQNYGFLNVFDASPVLASSHGTPTVNSLRFETIQVNDVSFDKNGWVHNATNIAYQGLDDAILDDFGFNLVTKVAHLTFHTDMDATYSYTSCGSLFSMPITGAGLAKVSLKNLQFGLSMPFDITEINEKKFIDLKGVNSWYQVRDKAVFNYENLYNGNKEQSEAIHNLFNKNWKFVTEEFGKDFSEKLVDGIFYKLKNYMLTMPLKDFATC